MRHWWWTLAVLFWGAPAGATPLTVAIAPAGTTMATAQAATGLATTGVDVRSGYRSIYISYCVAAGTATVKTQITCDKYGTLVDVVGSSKAIDSAGTACDGIGIDNPQCTYVTNVTARTGSVTTVAFPGTSAGR